MTYLFFPLLCSASQMTCVVFLAKLLTGFSMCYCFCTFHCRGAFLAHCLTQKFMLETVKCRCAGPGMIWPRWNDENRAYKITTELPVRKPLGTCQNRSERYRYFCNVSESSSGIFRRLAEVFLQFLSFPEHLRLGGKKNPFFFPTGQQRAGVQWEPLTWALRLGWAAAALKFAISYYYWRDGGLARGSLIYPVVAGEDGTSCPDAVFPIYNHYDDCRKGPGPELSQQGELHNYRWSQPALAQRFRNWVARPKALVRGRIAALEG